MVEIVSNLLQNAVEVEKELVGHIFEVQIDMVQLK